MPRKVKVVTTSFYGLAGTTAERNRQLACEYLGIAGREGADLACLPEGFLSPQGESGGKHLYSEPLSGDTLTALSEAARAQSMWVVACYYVTTGPTRRENVAVVIDRRGELVAQYAKVHPTIWECLDDRVTPGAGTTVVQTDFGRVGLAICYDIGWPDHWAELARRDAEIVVWPSAYDGGFPLQAYAWNHFYYVVSSVKSEHAKIIDLTGRVITKTSKWHRITSALIDLDKEVFHIDYQAQKLIEIEKELGARVSIDALSEENVFTIESHDSEWPLQRIKAHWGLENFRDYYARATRIQDQERDLARAATAAREGLSTGAP